MGPSSIRHRLGIGLFLLVVSTASVAQASYHGPNDAGSPEIRAAQKALWDTGVALEGPDTDTLTGDLRDHNGTGVHLSGKGLLAHGRLWAAKVGPWLERQLGQAAQ
jgi:hypothetical protein